MAHLHKGKRQFSMGRGNTTEKNDTVITGGPYLLRMHKMNKGHASAWEMRLLHDDTLLSTCGDC